jgi:mannose-6-phosphate isomerase
LASSEPRLEIARLEPVIQNYDWGSRHFLAELRGARSPSDAPEAELWLGTHPRGEARVVLASGASVMLAAWIEAEPAGVLGEAVLARHGARLPFLLKLLAVERALSLQAHPDAEQARAGFDREERAGVAASMRLYADRSAKPELVVAHGTFRALCGFRPLDEIRDLFARARLADLAPPPGAEPGRWLREFLARWLAVHPAERIARALDAASDADADAAFAWMAALAAQHPGDPGVIAPLLLNAIELAPGEALFLEAGELHCYLAGAAAEIMASSDNVLRAGLTTKPRAVDELLRIGRFAPRAPRVLHARYAGPGIATFATPAAEFELSRIEVGRGGVAIDAVGGVSVLLCVGGGARVGPIGAGPAVVLRSGQSCIVPASVGAHRLDGAGVFYRATVPRAAAPDATPALR